MRFIIFIVLFFLPTVSFAQRLTWEEQMLALVNVERASANEREFAIYGNYATGFREPLVLNDGLNKAAALWSKALKGTGVYDHAWYTRNGFLIKDYYDTTQISRVWVPSVNDYSIWTYRDNHFGVFPISASENGYLGGSTKPENVIGAWKAKWHVDPRKSSGHYSNMIQSKWTEAGFGKGTWGGGNSTVFAEFVEL